jgi:hypothetical protein
MALMIHSATPFTSPGHRWPNIPSFFSVPLSTPRRSRVSHIVQIQTQVRDAAAVEAACRRLGLPAPVEGTTRLFSGDATGLAVQLPGWNYPVVCDVTSGQLKYDNYRGRWGEPQQLDRFLQAYACEKAKIEARKKGHTVSEQALADGSIKLVIQVAGGAA